jgi:hypothetical protein
MIVRLDHLLDSSRKWSLWRSFCLRIYYLTIKLLARTLTWAGVFLNIAWSTSRFASQLMVALYRCILFLLNLVHWLKMLLRLISGCRHSTVMLPFSLARVPLSIYLSFWSLVMITLLIRLWIYYLRATLVLESWSMMASFLRLNHLWRLTFFSPNLIIENNWVDLIDWINILIFDIIIWSSNNASIFVFLSWVIGKNILIHQEIDTSTELVLRDFLKSLVLSMLRNKSC